MNYKFRKARELYAGACKEARLEQVSKPTDRRTKEDKRLTAQGWRRVVTYLSPREFRYLTALAETEGVALSVATRGLLHLLVDMESEEK